MKAIFSGGGTGGHIYPALSIAENFRENGFEIFYIGSENGMEKDIIQNAEIPFFGIEVKGFDRKKIFSNISVLMILFKSIIKVVGILKKVKPEFILVTGGYVSGPVIIAGKILGITVFIHEQNTVPGMTNRYGSMFAENVFTTFKNSYKYFRNESKVVWSGLPVRKEFDGLNRLKSYERFNLDKNVKTILIIGGSRGATKLNKVALDLYEKYLGADVQFIHVTGKNDFERISAEVETKNLNVDGNISIFPYLDNIYEALNLADICIARAGAAFISEMLYLGKTGILIPYPFATQNHQVKNAKDLVEENAALMIEERNIDNQSSEVIDKVDLLLMDEKLLGDMQKNSKRSGSNDTLDIINKTVFKSIER